MNTVKSPYSVPNLERSFLIMECLGQSREGLTLTELVHRTGLPQNSIFRICRTLEMLGYLTRHPETKRHHLTQHIINLALGAISPGKSIVSQAAPFLKEIAGQTGETCCLGTIVKNRGVVLAVEEGSNAFRFHIDLGTPFALHTSAPGKAMMAQLQDRERFVRELSLPAFNEKTITSHDDLLTHLIQVEQAGYGIDDEEELCGQRCVGAAIRTHTGIGVCSIWITAPSSRLKLEDFSSIGLSIYQACQTIEQQLKQP
jgi:DNA-binding IclR family transcriptional regulator